VVRTFVFDKTEPAVFEKPGGIFGEIRRTFVFEGMSPEMLRHHEGFLQFLIMVG